LAFLWLAEGVSVSAEEVGEAVVRGPDRQVTFHQLPSGTLSALRRLGDAGDDEARLADLVARTDGPAWLPRWFYFLNRLDRLGFLRRSAQADGVRLATLVPLTPAFVRAPAGDAPDRARVLSRFAYLHRAGGEVVLESPLAHARVVLHDCRAAALVAALARPRTAANLTAEVAGLPPDAVRQVIDLLAAARMLSEVRTDGLPAEEDDPALESWEFHDLLFHARSRAGRHDAPLGCTYRLAGRVPPAPPWRPAHAAETVELYRPNLERLRREDPPLARVQEERRSIREYAAVPLTDRHLGEFLYRVARVREFRETEVGPPDSPVPLVLTSRPYPAGGALYELEFYVVVRACVNLAAGLYHYDPLQHRLGRLSGPTAEVEGLLAEAALSAGIAAEVLQVLVILAARFPRVAWKYESIAYALILKHVGVVYQTMYLAATAMGLAPCALGCGDADLFARAAGTDYHAETSVGEFLLGSKP
jgi:SagB-type dehydrogenase family enzyme